MNTELNIGRDGEQTQHITDTAVNRQHAKLQLLSKRSGRCRISLVHVEDILMVNGQSVCVTECDSESDVRLGRNRFQLDMHSAISDLQRKVKRENAEDMANQPVEASPLIDRQPTPKAELQQPFVNNPYSGVDEDRLEQEQAVIPSVPSEEAGKDVPGEPSQAQSLERLGILYADYEHFLKKNNLMTLFAKLINVLPFVALLAVRLSVQKDIPVLVLIVSFVVFQATAIISGQYMLQQASSARAVWLTRMRKQYTCPRSKGKPLFYSGGSIPIPFPDIKDDLDCNLCGNTCSQEQKKNKCL